MTQGEAVGRLGLRVGQSATRTKTVARIYSTRDWVFEEPPRFKRGSAAPRKALSIGSFFKLND